MLDVTSSHKVRRMAEGRFKLTLSAVLTDNVSYVRIAGCSLFRVMPQTSAPIPIDCLTTQRSRQCNNPLSRMALLQSVG